jgi:polysaccharide chain length determinant protein, PEP-CTERM locus subfamily
MQELLAQITEYALGIWRHRWAALTSAWILSVAGWIWVAQMPEEYLASARVYVDTNRVLKPLLKGLTVDPNTKQRIAILSRTMLSRPNLEKLMRMTDLDLDVTGALEKEELLTQLRKNIRLSADRRNPSLYTISFQHPDRKTAKLMVQSLLSIFVEGTLGEKREETVGAQEFLEQQIAEYERRLTAAETRLVEFRQKHIDDLTGDVETYYERLQEAKSRSKMAKLQLQEMENRRKELERQLEDEEDESESLLGEIVDEGAASPELTTSLDPRIEALQAKLDSLLLKYTEKHPEVVQLKAMLKELKAQRAQELKKLARAKGPSTELQENPVYQQVRAMLAETEARIAELKIRDQAYANQVKMLEAKLESIPKVQAQLKQLNRDYRVLSDRYRKLIERRESVYISGEVEKRSENVKFRVIDPPFVPLEPTEPNKLLLNAGVFAGALVAGGGIAFLLALFRPVFMDPRTLARVTGLPVLGIVSLLETPERKRRELARQLLFALYFLVWVGAFVGVNLIQGVDAETIRALIPWEG